MKIDKEKDPNSNTAFVIKKGDTPEIIAMNSYKVFIGKEYENAGISKPKNWNEYFCDPQNIESDLNKIPKDILERTLEKMVSLSKRMTTKLDEVFKLNDFHKTTQKEWERYFSEVVDYIPRDENSQSNAGDNKSSNNTGDEKSPNNAGDNKSSNNTGDEKSPNNAGDEKSPNNTGDKKKPKERWYGPEYIYIPKIPYDEYGKNVNRVLIIGERGSGKDHIPGLLAEKWNIKSEVLAINCASIEPKLARSALFGYAKDSYTGASENTPGIFSNLLETEDYKKYFIDPVVNEKLRIKQKEVSVIFLDELHHLPVDIQAAILRTIENNEIQPLGMPLLQLDPKKNPKIIGAIQPKYLNNITKFLEDLRDRFEYRIYTKPLYDCPYMIQRLISIFIYEFYSSIYTDNEEELKSKLKSIRIREEHLWEMMAYRWPGNIRELRNFVYNCLAYTKSEHVDMSLYNCVSLPDWINIQTMYEIMFKKKEDANINTILDPGKRLDTKYLLSLFDLWNYSQVTLDKRNIYVPVSAMYANFSYESKIQQEKKERKLKDRAENEAKLNIYKQEKIDELKKKRHKRHHEHGQIHPLEELLLAIKEEGNKAKAADSYGLSSTQFGRLLKDAYKKAAQQKKDNMD